MISLLSLGALAGAATAAYAPFQVDPLSTHQPNGNPDGDVNYYNIAFSVGSTNSADGSNSTAECAQSWGDNSWEQQEAYSMNVPTDQWIQCGDSEYSFQLYPYFSIGNFTLAVQQIFTDSSGTSVTACGSMQVTNTTSQYTCSIDGEEVTEEQHAQGTCSIPSGGAAFSIAISDTSSTPVCTGNITASFDVAYTTTYGQNILLVGSIPALGSWDPSNAILMTGHYNGDIAWPTFTASVEIPAGSSFEYKYIFQDTDGSETWEGGDNRTGSVSSSSCDAETIGGTPDDFVSGGTAV